MAKRFALYGTRLWAVAITFDAPVSTISKRSPGRNSTSLWITTKADSLAMANQKAHTFLRHHVEEYPHPKVTGVVSHGSIDA